MHNITCIIILIYSIYFTCVIYEPLRFPKAYTVGVFAIDVSKNRAVAQNTDLINKSYEKIDYADIYSRSCYRSTRQFAEKKFTKIDIIENSTTQQYKNCKNRRNFFFRVSEKTHWRKLLSCESNFRGHTTARLHESNRRAIIARRSELQKIRNYVVRTNSESNDDEDLHAWDNWSKWSSCSVTCGQGRQVRWRHCLATHCVTGLKKAQLRSCRLKKCQAFRNIATDKTSSNVENIVNNALETKLIRSRRKIYNTDHDANNNRKNNIGPQRDGRSRKEPKIWDQWSNWSKCSVTCGIGKITRWRHCISGSCSLGQKKAQLKTCTSAAC